MHSGGLPGLGMDEAVWSPGGGVGGGDSSLIDEVRG